MARYPFIDVHSHHFRADGYDDDQMAAVVEDMDGLNMGLAVNLSGGWGEKLVSMIESMKGRYPELEIKSLPDDFAVTRVEKLDIPGHDAQRHLIEIIRR